MAHLRNCEICNAVYDYCPHCDDTKPTFYLKYCSENCRDIDITVNKYAFKHITREEASRILRGLKVNIESYKPRMQEYLKEILGEPIKEDPVESLINDVGLNIEDNKEEDKNELPKMRIRRKK